MGHSSLGMEHQFPGNPVAPLRKDTLMTDAMTIFRHGTRCVQTVSLLPSKYSLREWLDESIVAVDVESGVPQYKQVQRTFRRP